MEGLQKALLNGEQCLSSADFQAAVKCSMAETLQGAPEVKVTLENEELWREFYRITNEMIVTKAGRRMFPLLQVSVSDLCPSASYAVCLEFQLTDTHRWRFLNGEWQVATASGGFSVEPPEQRSVYIHPCSPYTGAQWMKEKVTFSKLKLSNKEDGKGKIKLHSLYRYQPCLHILQLPSPPHLHHSKGCVAEGRGISSHVFAKTQFVAVTAYQNDKITQMKIKHNPYAKAFQGPQDTIQFTRSRSDDASSSHPVSSTQSHPFHPPHTHTFPPHEPLGHPMNWLPPTLSHSYLYDSEPAHASYVPPSGCGLGLAGYSHPGPGLGQEQYRTSNETLMPVQGAPRVGEEVSGQASGHWSLGHRQQQVTMCSSHQQVWYSDSPQLQTTAPPLQYNT